MPTAPAVASPWVPPRIGSTALECGLGEVFREETGSRTHSEVLTRVDPDGLVPAAGSIARWEAVPVNREARDRERDQVRNALGHQRLGSSGALTPQLPTKRRRSAFPTDRARGAAVPLAAGPATTSDADACGQPLRK